MGGNHILTANNEVYYYGERDDFDENGSTIASNPNSGKGTRIAIAWAEEIKSAYQQVAATQKDKVMMQQLIKEPPEEEEKEEQPKVNRFNYQIFVQNYHFSKIIAVSGNKCDGSNFVKMEFPCPQLF